MEHIDPHVPWSVRIETKDMTFEGALFFTEDDRNFAIGKTS
jgi:hypothetical protein